MRYYAIKIFGAPSMFTAAPGASIQGAQWCSQINGANDPGAQQVEWQLDVAAEHAPGANCVVTIHGIPFAQVKQAADLHGKSIEIYGGMAKGLPLATAQSTYAGLLVSGQIYTCWSSWIGTDTSLSFSVAGGGEKKGGSEDTASNQVQTVQKEPSTGRAVGPVMAQSYNRSGPRGLDTRAMPMAADAASAISSLFNIGSGFESIGGILSFFFGQGGSISKHLNLIHNMKPNQLLSDAIRQTLSTAFPNAQLNINISPNLKLAYQDAGMYQSLPQYAAYIKQLSHSILGTQDYMGVRIFTHGTSLNVNDHSGASSSTNIGPATSSTSVGAARNGQNQVSIGYLDLIGQPSWIGVGEINFKCVMRSDIQVGDDVILPPGLMSVQQGGSTPEGDDSLPKRGALSFQGPYVIETVTHIGDFRSPDGNAWCTSYTAAVNKNTTGQDTATSDTEKANAAQNPAFAGASATASTGKSGSFPFPQMTRSVRRY